MVLYIWFGSSEDQSRKCWGGIQSQHLWVWWWWVWNLGSKDCVELLKTHTSNEIQWVTAPSLTQPSKDALLQHTHTHTKLHFVLFWSSWSIGSITAFNNLICSPFDPDFTWIKSEPSNGAQREICGDIMLSEQLSYWTAENPICASRTVATYRTEGLTPSTPNPIPPVKLQQRRGGVFSFLSF